MATYNQVFVETRFASVDNAKKSDKKAIFKEWNSKVFRKVWEDAMRGKIKDFIEAHKIDSEHYGMHYNGYGWSDHVNNYFMTASDGKAFIALVEGKKVEQKPAKTWEQTRDAWCRRLVKLLADCEGYEWVTMEVAQEIAEEKLDYKQQQINMVESRQYDRYSVKRQKLINKMERENPLRRIEGYDHAIAIIKASERHNNSNYEELLDEYREEAKWGLIDHSEVKQLARENYRAY